MAISVAIKRTSHIENNKVVTASITLDSSYPTGGEVVVPSDFGLQGIDHMIVGSPPLGGFLATYDPIAGKIKLWQSTTGAPALLVEVADTTSAATAVVPVLVFGF